jgi:hypothetical protein
VKAEAAVTKAKLSKTKTPSICSYDFARKRKCPLSAGEFIRISMKPSNNLSINTMKRKRVPTIAPFKKIVIATYLCAM